MTEIINELPRLSSEDRDLISKELRRLADAEDILFMTEAAECMFREMDAQEEKDGTSKTWGSLAVARGMVAELASCFFDQKLPPCILPREAYACNCLDAACVDVRRG